MFESNLLAINEPVTPVDSVHMKIRKDGGVELPIMIRVESNGVGLGKWRLVS